MLSQNPSTKGDREMQSSASLVKTFRCPSHEFDCLLCWIILVLCETGDILCTLEDSHIKKTGVLVVIFKDLNSDFVWYFLWCSASKCP